MRRDSETRERLRPGGGQFDELCRRLPAQPEGLQLNRAFVRIKDPKVRRKVIDLVKALAAEDDD